MATEFEEAIALLRSIDASLKAARRSASGARRRRHRERSRSRRQVRRPGREVHAARLDRPSYKGRQFSECPPELLDMLAETFDYFAEAKPTRRANERTNKRQAGRRLQAGRRRRGRAAGRSGFARARCRRKQEAGFHAMIAPWAKAEGHAIEDLKRDLLAEIFGLREHTDVLTGVVVMVLREPHTSKLSKKKYSELIERTLEIGARCGHVLIAPNEWRESKERASLRRTA
jgi:hypothetical protein